jgi:hypothetical protein
MLIMSKDRHDKVIDVLFTLAKSFKPYHRVYADHISKDYKPITIFSSQKRGQAQVLSYYPDLWCKIEKTNKIDVFEVWDSQSEDACVTDIVLAALTPNVQLLYVICFDKEQYDLALKLVKVILTTLFNDEGKPLLEPSEVAKYVTLIPDEVVEDNRKLKKFLHDELDF